MTTMAPLAAPRRRSRKLTGLALGVAIVGALLAALTGCSLIGDMMQPKTTLAENLEYQRIAAKKFKQFQPDVAEITFTREGSFDGSGQWTTNAIVTIEGEQYREILGPHEIAGAPLPDPSSSLGPIPVTINYSDGTSEVLK